MKKFWLGLMALSLMLPAWAMAGGYASPSSDQLLQRLDQLTRELESVKQELHKVKAEQGQLAEQQEDLADTVDENADGIDEINTNGVNRFQVFGDYRFRLDSTRLNTNGFTGNPNLATTAPWASEDHRGERITNDTLYTNRLRLGMKVKATDNITFKGRLAMYKIWGMESANKTNSGLFPMNSFSYDPNMSRRPNDNTLRVEMAYVNWVNIFDLPMWVSVGRRPTVDGPPAQLRYNYDSRYATPTALGVDWTFDGATLGWAGDQLYFPGAKFRICYGRGYEAGLDYIGNNSSGDLSDSDLYGFSWDIINDKEAHRFANLQFFRAASLPNMMEGMTTQYAGQNDLMSYSYSLLADASDEVGDIYHTSFVYMDEFRGVNWFVSGGLSRTDDRDTNNGYHQSYGLLTNPGETKQNHWGWAAYAGARIPVEMLSSKIGFEYNYGSRYWINFTPAADDVYSSKLATRGHVAEVYWIWDIPENPLSKYAKTFIRAGYQYYWFNYTGSGNWMGRPVDVDDVNMSDPQTMDYSTLMGAAPVEHMDNLYLTFEVYF